MKASNARQSNGGHFFDLEPDPVSLGLIPSCICYCGAVTNCGFAPLRIFQNLTAKPAKYAKKMLFLCTLPGTARQGRCVAKMNRATPQFMTALGIN